MSARNRSTAKAARRAARADHASRFASCVNCGARTGGGPQTCVPCAGYAANGLVIVGQWLGFGRDNAGGGLMLRRADGWQ